jgi:uracil-DNA glycosylase
MPWSPYIEAEFQKPYFQELSKTLAKEAKQYTILPAKEDIFKAFRLCELEDVRVICLAQDPYANRVNACGLCFATNPGVPIPASLKNIHKELQSDLNIQPPNHGDLRAWCKEGVMLLNTILTVREGQSASHRNLGWEKFTDAMISVLNQQDRPLAWIMWGSYAQSKMKLLDNSKHLIISSSHPSPLSTNQKSSTFFGSKPFSKVNEFLQAHEISPINWHIGDVNG